MRRLLSEPCILLAAAPASAPCFRRWRRSPQLQAIPSPALLPLCGNRVPPQRTVLGETPGTPNTTLTVQAKRLLGRYELPTIQRLTALCSARRPEQTRAFAALRAEAERLTAENACCRVSQLAVNGRDLMAAGVRPGPGLRQMLNALLETVITGQTPNEKDALLAAAAQFSAS